jgi:hypothetical protein
MIIKTTSSSENIEHDNLATHVELCSQRNDIINKNISALETRQDKLETALASSKFLMLKAIGVATAVLSSAVSLTVIILDRLH